MTERASAPPVEPAATRAAPDATSAPDAALAKAVDERPLLAVGYAIIAAFLVTFFVWGGTAELSSAAIAPGTVSVEGRPKSVQHPDGGIVREILVADGDRVVAGQPLLRLDAVDARAHHDELDEQLVRLGVELARWRAERRALPSIVLSEALAARAAEPRVVAALETQTEILEARRATLTNTREALERELAQIDEETLAAERLLERLGDKLALVEGELAEYRGLERRGLTTRADVFELENDRSDLVLELDATRAEIAIAEQRRAQSVARLAELASARRQETAEQTTLVRDRLDSLRQQLSVARERLERTTIRAPITGQVVGASVNTIGAVISAGELLMQIVPEEGRLLIESRVDPKDRDAVEVGQTAEVRFSAFDRRSTLPVSGTVTLISADRLVDAATQLPYYRATIALEDDPHRVLHGAEIHPGMQADVLIATGEQTLLGYLLSPLQRSFDRALRED